ncbi:hypothetical protein BpHYR1_006096 [Brachionus plicatilis]|uniref:Uncharacterized protein n=1 Tax=Brachionus plicatilis TaxID=10195 RepID=A0A3M7SFF1_BRAPC|nr:hypothetical protein BpHYR1_006096 [Brachionus plicatilis]
MKKYDDSELLLLVVFNLLLNPVIVVACSSIDTTIATSISPTGNTSQFPSVVVSHNQWTT